jgi:shikimate dehydrogenase
MRKFGLIGFPLTHSFSRKYFTQKFSVGGIDAIYDNYPLEDIGDLSAVIAENPELEGINVTIPHKQAVISCLHDMSEVVKETGACNCIRIRHKRLEGFNTDVIGFDVSLSTHLSAEHTKALVLGTGGASKAVCYVLNKRGISWLQVSRNPVGKMIHYNDISHEILSEYLLVINTTPLGMYPNVDDCPPLPYEAITGHHYLFDLVYNPSVTLFLQKGKERGAIVENGYSMLEIQAEESWKIWNS